LQRAGNVLTDIQIKRLALPKVRKEVPDGKITGLYLVVQPSGAKSWAVRYRLAGQPKKLTLGPYPAIDLATARKRAQEAIGDVAGGKDPASEKKATRALARAERDAEDSRLDRIAASYLDRYVKRSVGEAWGKEIERLLRVEILPKLGDKHIAAIKKANILDLLDAIVDRGSPITANRAFAVLRQLFNWAADRDLITVSPMPKSAPAPENARDRVLSDKEIRLVWRAFDQIGRPFGSIGKLLLLTGARRDEIAEGSWSEIDLEARTWTIPRTRTKNEEAHEIPLSDTALDILRDLPRIAGKLDLVFTTTGRTAVSGFSKAKAAIDAAVLEILKEKTRDRGEDADAAFPHFTLHDLRRTVATNMQKLGVRLEVTEAVLNHMSGSRAGIVGVYQRHKWSTEKRAALDAWALVLEAIVTGASDEKLKEMRERAQPFVTSLKGSAEEKRVKTDDWVRSLDAMVTGATAMNVVEFATARA
jgi:integrase